MRWFLAATVVFVAIGCHRELLNRDEPIPPEPPRAEVGGIVPPANSPPVEWPNVASFRVETNLLGARPQLALSVDGPDSATVGDTPIYELRLTNVGQGDVAAASVRVDLPPGLEHSSAGRTVDVPISRLPPGEFATARIPLTVRQSGRLQIVFECTCNGAIATKAERYLEVAEQRLQVQITGPAQAAIGQQVAFDVKVVNSNPEPIANANVHVQLPSDVTFASASDGGRILGSLVTWSLPQLGPRQTRDFQLTVVPAKRTGRTNIVATASAPRAVECRAGHSLDIVGVPQLKLLLRQSEELVGPGGRVVYTIEVRNAGSTQLTSVGVVATCPSQLNPLFGFGPTLPRIEGGRVSFLPIASLDPGQSETFRIEAEAAASGDARVSVEAQSPTLTRPVIQDIATRVAQ